MNNQITEIASRVKLATTGPWHYERGETFYGVDPNSLRSTLHYVVADNPDTEDDPPLAQVRHHLDAEFIAHARTDVPHLLSLVEQLQGQLDAVREIADGWQETIDSGLMAGSEWEGCLRANLPEARAALGKQTTKTAPADTTHIEAALAKIRACMHIGLQDAALYDEPGRERIAEWADLIDREIRQAITQEDTK